MDECLQFWSVFSKKRGTHLRWGYPFATLDRTAMGYLDQTRQGTRSTKKTKKMHAKDVEEVVEDDEVGSRDEFLRWNVCSTHDMMNSSDATGRFPICSKSGWEYILVSTMGGYVHLELLKDRTKEEYVRAYKSMYTYFQRYGHTPRLQRLDNESSSDLKNF